MVRRFSNYIFTGIDARPLVIFRFILIAALALHFLPAAFNHRDNYGTSSFRVPVILPELGETLLKIPGSMQITHLLFVGALIGALSLVFTRLFFFVIVLCLYAYLSVNALNTNTLGLWPALNICTLFAIFPSGNSRFFLKDRFKLGIEIGAVPRLLPLLILVQIFGAFFFSGLEKLIAGWYQSDPMKDFLSLPAGSIVRSWVYDLFPSGVPGGVSTVLTIATLAGELILPILAFFRKIRKYVLISYEIFFAAVMTALDIPPLFYLIFAGGGLLLLSNNAVTGKKSDL
jgi:hypothetical protein